MKWENDKVSCLLLQEIENNIVHPLHKFCSYKYYTDFFDMVNLFTEKGYFDKQKNIRTFFRHLHLSKPDEEMQYYQGVSELLFIYFALENNLFTQTNKKMLVNCNNDIDLQIKEAGFEFNIEIKCPVFEKHNEQGILKINPSFRSIHDKSLFDKEMRKVLCEVAQPIVDNSNNQYTGYVVKKISDQKLKDYLKSGQSKFAESDNNSINILVVAVPITNMQDYCSYLYNHYSGFFAKEDNGICSADEYNKVDVVYLTSLVTGHMRPRDTFNSWKLSSYCNLLCINPFSKKYQSKFYNGYERALELLPNSTKEFENVYVEFAKEAEMRNMPLQELIFPYYFDKNFSHLWK